MRQFPACRVLAEARCPSDYLELAPDITPVRLRAETGAEDEIAVRPCVGKLGPLSQRPLAMLAQDIDNVLWQARVLRDVWVFV
jgi:hypothetical protein